MFPPAPSSCSGKLFNIIALLTEVAPEKGWKEIASPPVVFFVENEINVLS